MSGRLRTGRAWRFLTVWVAVVACLAVLTQGRIAEVWECSMSGTRDCPCECSEQHRLDDPTEAAHRPSCCEVQPQAVASAVVVPAGAHLDAAPSGASVVAVAGPRVAQPSLPPSARGPPGPSCSKFIAHCSLLL